MNGQGKVDNIRDGFASGRDGTSSFALYTVSICQDHPGYEERHRALVIERDEDIAGADGGIDGAYEQVQKGTIAVTNAMDGLVIWHQPALPCASQGVYAAGKFLHSTSNFASSQATWNCPFGRMMVKAAPICIPFDFYGSLTPSADA